jgi:hypothetical protein
MRCAALLLSAGLMLSAGCESPRGRTEPSSEPAATRPTPSARSSAEADASAANQPLLGRWSGSYRSRRVTIEMPRGLPAGAWQHDDGSLGSGEGRIELEVRSDSELRGTATGALGELDIRGMVEGDSVRAGLTPRNPMADPAMSGILMGQREGQQIVGELRVSSQDGSLVRSAPVSLKRPCGSARLRLPAGRARRGSRHVPMSKFV